MASKIYKDKNINYLLLFGGIVSMAFGIIAYQFLEESAHSLNMLMGMFTGMGAAFVVIGIINIIRLKRTSPEKLRLQEIERKDERNLAVWQKSYSVLFTINIFLLAILAFLFVGLGYSTPAFCCIGVMYVDLIVLLIVHRYFNKRM